MQSYKTDHSLAEELDPRYLSRNKYKLELINKSYFVTAKEILSEKEYLENFNWFSYWFKRNFIEISENLATMIIPILLYVSLLKKEKEKKIFVSNIIISFCFFVLIGFLFWLEFSPVYRFGIIYFLISFTSDFTGNG